MVVWVTVVSVTRTLPAWAEMPVAGTDAANSARANWTPVTTAWWEIMTLRETRICHAGLIASASTADGVSPTRCRWVGTPRVSEGAVAAHGAWALPSRAELRW